MELLNLIENLVETIPAACIHLYLIISLLAVS